MGNILFITFAFLVFYFIVVVTARYVWTLFIENVFDRISKSFHRIARGRSK